ncbi:MAG: thioredoxin domain-containing protein [bacterium]|nr:thioredoxin domain-containing protein [bacterium]
MTDSVDTSPPSRDPNGQNRLAGEKSPYLLQHADNPVDWHPWGDAAFKLAEEQDKPIFLSIGYATCHWCHVMEHESFEDPEVAQAMNDAFINIKVDREERPDIDQVYMAVCQMMTGSGGWPLTIIMTPDRRPFFSATYIPKQSAYGRIGMMELIPKVTEVWRDRREELLKSADTVVGHLQSTGHTQGESPVDLAVIGRGARELKERYDPTHGGFGGAPKFPSPHNLSFLLRYAREHDDEQAQTMVEHTLVEMRRGGIYDQVGFGFHRYSTDREWLVPHFEKMLYDQATLTLAYTDAYTMSGKDTFRSTIHEILTYVLRDMTSSDGAFFSAEDADSEGVEGKFYVWETKEFSEVVGADHSKTAQSVWNVRNDGNFTEETGGHTGTNILHLSQSLGATAQAAQLEEAALSAILEKARQRLFERREARIHPLKDDKVLTDWNGLMAAAFARAGLKLNEPKYIDAAARASSFIYERMRDSKGRLQHRLHSGEVAVPAFLDDHAFLTWAEIELYNATLDPIHLERALKLQDEADRLFWDEDGGGYYFTGDGNEALLVRQKEIYDGAIPSGNSVAMNNLIRLARYSGRSKYEARAQRIAAAFAPQLQRMPSGHTWALNALTLAATSSLEVVICGDSGDPGTQQMIDLVRAKTDTEIALVLLEPGSAGERIRSLAPFLASNEAIDGSPTAYVCRNFSCNLPTTDPDKLLDQLAIGRSSRKEDSPGAAP